MADPFRNFRFKLEIDGVIQAGFTECTGFDTSTDVIEYREGSDAPHVRKLPGLNKAGDIVLKWGVTDSLELFNWRQQVIDGQLVQARRRVSIIILDETGSERMRWRCENAWPSKCDPPDLNAKGNDVAISTLTLSCEEVQVG